MAITKLPVKKIIEFKRLSDLRKKTFGKNLHKVKEKKDSGGGDYWIRSISSIGAAYKLNDNSIINDRLERLKADHSLCAIKRTKTMYERNITILEKYVGFDFSPWIPDQSLDFISRPNSKSILLLEGLPVQILPNHVFRFEADGTKQIGAIWFVTWLEGYKQSDLGMYSEAIYKYLSINYKDDYVIDPSNCMAVDVTNSLMISYKQVLNGTIPSVLDDTLREVKSMLDEQ